MKKILAIITTLFLMFSLVGFENNVMKVDALPGATLGEYNLSAEDWYIYYEGSANNREARQESYIKTKNNYMFAQLYTGFLKNASIKLVPAFSTKFTDVDSCGKVKNVGDIKSIKLNCYNFGYNNTIYLNFERSNGEKFRCKMGDLDAHKKGPVELVFNNASYIEDPKYKKFNDYPIYPNSANDLYLVSVEIHSNNVSPYDGYNFIGIGDISIIYDQARLETEESINFDELFGIDESSDSLEKKKEIEKLSQRKYKEKYNKDLMDKTETISEK